MTEPADAELYEQAVSLLSPGETPLVGVVVHTDLPQAEEPAMNKLMKQVGDRIAEQLTEKDTYIYAGEDDERFGTGQFHGRTLEAEEVIWECQQLLRDGTFDLVFYWEDSNSLSAILDELEDLDNTIVPITEDGFVVP